VVFRLALVIESNILLHPEVGMPSIPGL